MLEQLYREISEKRLYDTVININKRTIVSGTPPTAYVGSIFTADPHSPDIYDFTHSFLTYMNHNKPLLSFKFSVVPLPSFLIFSIDSTQPNNLQLVSKADVVRTFKLPLTASETYILSCDMTQITSFYDRILSEINHLVKTKGMDKQLYFYRLTGVKNPMTDIFSFMMRGSINTKDLSK